jgi:uncharacterized protein YjbJ (UPF0337 family)
MNWDRVEGNWKQVTGKVKEQWGKLTDNRGKERRRSSTPARQRAESAH